MLGRRSQVGVPRKGRQGGVLPGAEDDDHAEHAEHGEHEEPLQELVVVHVEGEGELVGEKEPVPIDHLHYNSSRRSHGYRGQLHPLLPRLVDHLVTGYAPLSLIIAGNQQGRLCFLPHEKEPQKKK